MRNSHSNPTSQIQSSINNYRDLILKDIKSKLRLINEDDKIHTTDIHSWDDNSIVFIAPIDKQDWVIFLVPSKIQACFVTGKAIFMTTLELVERRMESNIMYYHTRFCAPIIKKQQRQHFRLEMLSPLQYSVIPEEDEQSNENDLFLLERHAGTTINLSVGGMCMVCNHQLQPDQRLYIYFDFFDHSFAFIGTVLDNIPNAIPGTYSHRIQFDTLDNRTSDTLSKLLFEKQRQTLRPNTHPLHSTKA